VTAVYVPEGRSAIKVKQELQRGHGIVVATGMGDFKDSVLRIAHMGYCSSAEIEDVLKGLRAVLYS